MNQSYAHQALGQRELFHVARRDYSPIYRRHTLKEKHLQNGLDTRDQHLISVTPMCRSKFIDFVELYFHLEPIQSEAVGWR